MRCSCCKLSLAFRYVSCVLGCPYEGEIKPDAVGFVAQALQEMGCYEISLGDTIGVGTPVAATQMIRAVKDHIPVHMIAAHFHNTYAMALPNLLAALQEGVSVVDSSVAGLGGCPYAAGATGNVATEDVLFMCQGMGIETGVDIDKVIDVGQDICAFLGKRNESNVANAMLSKRAAVKAADEKRRAVEAQAREKTAAAEHENATCFMASAQAGAR